jgi:hypothetical protein
MSDDEKPNATSCRRGFVPVIVPVTGTITATFRNFGSIRDLRKAAENKRRGQDGN